ncbi:MAG: tail fiber domain-containing protein [Melioribacteraceae bacterium]|nr:MAG: tail fiber domain-containing protein [Melioribacteraceae bacterium]
MKKTLLVVLFLVVSNTAVFSQNITNTLGTNGLFTVKDATSNFLTIDQSDGKITVQKILDIKNTSNSTTGLISREGVNFLHTYGTNNIFIGNYSGNFSLTGSKNVAIGSNSLGINTTGYQNTSTGYFSLAANTTGYNNTSIGQFALRANSVGFDNTSVGSFSLRTNSDGEGNSAFGMSALYSNTSGLVNSSFGYYSMYSNTTGDVNSAFGYNSLYSNTDGSSNSAFGESALYANTLGISNSAFGRGALSANTTGDYNTAVGLSALAQNVNGNNNTAIGNGAGSLITGSNNTAIGNGAQVPNAGFNNQVRIGNTSITYAGVQVAWTVTSDKRWKENIQSSPLGLEFISKLNPVSYTRNNDEKQKSEFGLIAQELEEVLKEFNIENPGMLTIDDDGYYHLRYNDLLSPMIKAIQELSEGLQKEKFENKNQIAELKKENENLKKEYQSEITALINRLSEYENKLNILTAKFYSEENDNTEFSTVSK